MVPGKPRWADTERHAFFHMPGAQLNFPISYLHFNFPGCLQVYRGTPCAELALFVAPRGVRHQITGPVSCALALRMEILWSLDQKCFLMACRCSVSWLGRSTRIQPLKLDEDDLTAPVLGALLQSTKLSSYASP